VVRFESEEEEEKNNDSEKFFFFTHAKRHKIYCTVLDFFSLSRSRSLRSSSSSSRATTPRERERERCAHLFKNDAPRLSFRETYLRVLSLCSFAAALNIFYSFSSRRESG
jgi:ADP-heptose:LPS heptosyltransferase